VRLTGELSVHASDWPSAAAVPDTALVDEMAAARQLVGLGRAARTEAKLRTRQPLRRALLVHPPDVELGPEVREQIREELNVKDLQDVASLADLVSWTAVPNFKTLGPRLGKRVNDIKQALADADGTAIKATLEEQGWVEVAGERLDATDVELRADQREDFALVSEGAWAVAHDRDLDESLRVEGTARELIRDINELRKKSGMSITDRIVVTVDASRAPRVTAALDEHGDSVAREVLAVKLTTGEVADGYDVDVDGEPVRIALNRSDD
jgi:isoleucyl-tRNA synthetase